MPELFRMFSFSFRTSTVFAFFAYLGLLEPPTRAVMTSGSSVPAPAWTTEPVPLPPTLSSNPGPSPSLSSWMNCALNCIN